MAERLLKLYEGWLKEDDTLLECLNHEANPLTDNIGVDVSYVHKCRYTLAYDGTSRSYRDVCFADMGTFYDPREVEVFTYLSPQSNINNRVTSIPNVQQGYAAVRSVVPGVPPIGKVEQALEFTSDSGVTFAEAIKACTIVRGLYESPDHYWSIGELLAAGEEKGTAIAAGVMFPCIRVGEEMHSNRSLGHWLFEGVDPLLVRDNPDARWRFINKHKEFTKETFTHTSGYDNCDMMDNILLPSYYYTQANSQRKLQHQPGWTWFDDSYYNPCNNWGAWLSPHKLLEVQPPGGYESCPDIGDLLGGWPMAGRLFPKTCEVAWSGMMGLMRRRRGGGVYELQPEVGLIAERVRGTAEWPRLKEIAEAFMLDSTETQNAPWHTASQLMNGQLIRQAAGLPRYVELGEFDNAIRGGRGVFGVVNHDSEPDYDEEDYDEW